MTACNPLKFGTIVASFTDFITALLAFIASVGGFIYFEQNVDNVKQALILPPENLQFLQTFFNFENWDVDWIRISLIFFTVFWFQRIGLSMLLLRAVFKEDRIHLHIWMVYSIILLTFTSVCYLAAMLFGLLGLMSIPVYICFFCIREHSICLVSNYDKKFGGLYLKTLSDW